MESGKAIVQPRQLQAHGPDLEPWHGLRPAFPLGPGAPCGRQGRNGVWLGAGEGWMPPRLERRGVLAGPLAYRSGGEPPSFARREPSREGLETLPGFPYQLLRWPPMKAPFRFAATALVLALAAVALYPVADRVLARRSARQQLRELERALASKPAPLVADEAPE